MRSVCTTADVVVPAPPTCSACNVRERHDERAFLRFALCISLQTFNMATFMLIGRVSNVFTTPFAH